MPRWGVVAAAACLLVVFGCGGGAGARVDEAARLARGEGGADAAARLQDLAADRDPRVRAVALAGLVRIAPEEGAEAVVNALRDADPQVRAVAARAAGERRIAGAAAALSDLARSDAADGVRRQAVEALSGLPGPVADAALAAAVDDPAAAIRLAAVRSLSEEGVRLAAGTLAARAIGDVSWEVRAAALEALARAGLPRAWAAAEAAEADGNEFVRAAAAGVLDGLRRRGVPRVDPAVDEPPGGAVYTPRPDLDAGGPIAGPPDSP
jgi:HEAT repeat protein